MIEIIPNWHPILVHFTIALLAIAALLFVAAALVGRESSRGLEVAANWNLWIGAAITVLTIAAGLWAAGSVAHDDAAHIAMQSHKSWAFATAALFMLLAAWNLWRVRRAGRVGLAFLAVMLVALGGLAGTGLRGADLVFRHGLGVIALPQVADAGHSHVGDAGHSHDADGQPAAGSEAEHSHDAADQPAAGNEAEHLHDGADADAGGHGPQGATPAPVVAPSALTSAEAEVVAVLTAYHDALTSGDAALPEQFVLADERFVMIEGEHVNRDWADYRDHHLAGELGDLARVRFRLSDFRVQMDDRLAAVSFLFSILPKTGPEMDFGSGRATAVLVRTGSGWKLQLLHTS